MKYRRFRRLGPINKPIDPNIFSSSTKILQYFQERCFRPRRLRLRRRKLPHEHPPGERIPWSNLFAYNMFLRPDEKELLDFNRTGPSSAPRLPCRIGRRRHPAAQLRHHQFHEKQIIIGGTGYTGEIKKGIFSVLNYVLPKERGVLWPCTAPPTSAKTAIPPSSSACRHRQNYPLRRPGPPPDRRRRITAGRMKASSTSREVLRQTIGQAKKRTSDLQRHQTRRHPGEHPFLRRHPHPQLRERRHHGEYPRFLSHPPHRQCAGAVCRHPSKIYSF